MRAEQSVEALYLDTSTNLRYFTGIDPRSLTERLHGAVIPAEGEVAYLSPTFEEPKTRDPAEASATDIRCWEEHEDPTALVIETVRSKGYRRAAPSRIDPAAPFFTVDGLRKRGQQLRLRFNGREPDGGCAGRVKSPAEVAL